jgi:hypothetical protein
MQRQLNKSSITPSDVPSVASVESIPEGFASMPAGEDPTVRAGMPMGHRGATLARVSANNEAPNRHSLELAIQSMGLESQDNELGGAKGFGPLARQSLGESGLISTGSMAYPGKIDIFKKKQKASLVNSEGKFPASKAGCGRGVSGSQRPVSRNIMAQLFGHLKSSMCLLSRCRR